jgi:hypothetical protein
MQNISQFYHKILNQIIQIIYHNNIDNILKKKSRHIVKLVNNKRIEHRTSAAVANFKYTLTRRRSHPRITLPIKAKIFSQLKSFSIVTEVLLKP